MFATIGRFILDYIVSKAVEWLTALFAKLRRQKEIEEKAKESVDSLKKADPNNEKKIDEGAKDALDGF